MGNEWGKAYRYLFDQAKAGKSPAELWEEARTQHWKLMREAWVRWDALRKEHDRLGYNASNPFEP